MSQPSGVVTSAVDRRRRVSPIWLIPLLTALLGAWIAWTTLARRGPTITITFDSAEGLIAGQSHIKHKDVDLGLVTGVALSPDMSHVLVTARMQRAAEPFLTTGARFWVVKPRLFAGSISGLDTLVSGAYMEMLPAAPGGASAREFTGLETPPLLTTDTPGRTFLLHANRVGSLNIGSPVFYRDLNVGEILGWDLGELAKTVTIHAFVKAPYDKYVHDDSRFWNASGISVKLGTQGVDVQLESLRALLLGGVAFDTPTVALKSPISAENQTFPLFSNEDAANNAAFRQRIEMIGYFPGSVSGLGPGSPVTFHGLHIGKVIGVNLDYDADLDSVRAPVRFEVEPERIAHIGLMEGRGPLANITTLVGRGLRAQLQSVSLITGQKSVALDFFPDAPAAKVEVEDKLIVMPTMPGQFDDITRSAGDLVAKLEKLPFEQMSRELTSTLSGASAIANDPAVAKSLRSMSATMTLAQDVMKRLDAGATPALRRLPELAASLQETLSRTNALLASADKGYGENSTLHRQLDRMAAQMTDTLESLRQLSDLLTRHPEALIRGRTGRGLQ